MIVYLNGKFVEASEAQVSVFDRGFLFGDGVYEGLRCFGGRVIQLQDHVNRLRRSLTAISLDHFDPHIFESIYAELLALNDLRDAGMYWQVTRGAGDGRSHVPQLSDPPTTFAMVWPMPSLDDIACEPGCAKAILRPDERWTRCDIKSINLLPNVLARMEAESNGAFEAILHRGDFATEGASSSLFIGMDDGIVTPPIGDRDATGEILHGTMRRNLVAAAREAATKVEIRPIRIDELSAADEIMISSSTKLVMAVTDLDGRSIGSGRAGPLCRRLHDVLINLIRREIQVSTK